VRRGNLPSRLRVASEAAGFTPVRRELPVIVWHEDFSKTYYVDCVARDSVIYELKAVSALTSAHPKQLLTYLFLLQQPRGVLLNFRPARLEHRFVSTRLTLAKRRAIKVHNHTWRPLCDNCEAMRHRLLALIEDWGAFLELALYQEALVHFLGGEAAVFQPVTIRRSGQPLGSQTMFLLDREIALRLTAHTSGAERVEAHLRRLLQHCGLRAVQWVNLNHENIEFRTVTC
jgi:GxxExxY protein